MLFPSASLASDAAGGCAVTQDLKVSTGVTAPQIIQTAEISSLTQSLAKRMLNSEVNVTLQVNEKGQAKNIRVVNSTNPLLDAGVVAAVQRYVFRPATLDNQAIPMDMDLKINFQY